MHNEEAIYLLMQIVFTLVLGSLILSIIDPTTRPMFLDIAKISITGIIGWLIPSPKK